MISYRKIGGLHFVKVWRLSISFCLTSGAPKPERKRSAKMPKAALPLASKSAMARAVAVDRGFAAIESALFEAESILAEAGY